MPEIEEMLTILRKRSVPCPASCFAASRQEGRAALMPYMMGCFPDREGALVGKHIVTITTAAGAKSDGAAAGGERVPKAWRDGSQRFEVPAGGTTAANFDLKSQ